MCRHMRFYPSDKFWYAVRVRQTSLRLVRRHAACHRLNSARLSGLAVGGEPSATLRKPFGRSVSAGRQVVHLRMGTAERKLGPSLPARPARPARPGAELAVSPLREKKPAQRARLSAWMYRR